jgi:hypothetical protein
MKTAEDGFRKACCGCAGVIFLNSPKVHSATSQVRYFCATVSFKQPPTGNNVSNLSRIAVTGPIIFNRLRPTASQE